MFDKFYEELERNFRGDESMIKARLSFYKPFLDVILARTKNPKAFDFGCGRGEWLGFLKELGFEEMGVDINEKFVLRCEEKGLNAVLGDGFEYLEKLPSDSIDIFSSFQVIEHIDMKMLLKLLQEAHRVLKDDGLIILETPNCENLFVSSKTFYMDPTHIRIIPPELLQFCAKFIGFSKTKIARINQAEDGFKKEHIGIFDIIYNSSMDYALIASKSSKVDELDELFLKDYGVTTEYLATRMDQRINSQEEIFEKNNTIIEKKRLEIINLNNKLNEKENILNDMINSKSWKITKPLRMLSSRIKNIFKTDKIIDLSEREKEILNTLLKNDK